MVTLGLVFMSRKRLRKALGGGSVRDLRCEPCPRNEIFIWLSGVFSAEFSVLKLVRVVLGRGGFCFSLEVCVVVVGCQYR